jgi:hypothetical protein
MVERAWPNDYQGKRYYFAKVNGQQLQTTDPEVGEALISQVGKEILAQVDPSPKPGKWYLKAFEPVTPAERVSIGGPAASGPSRPDVAPSAPAETPGRLVPAEAPQGPKPPGRPVPPPAEQPLAGKIDKAWCQGEPGACVYIARVDGIHVQTRVSDSKLNATESPKLFATEMDGRRPTPIFATNLVSEARDLALRGFVSPLGSRARQTLMSGSLGTLALYATPPIQSIRQSWASSGKAPMA